MNKKDFTNFLAISGMEPEPSEPQEIAKPTPKAAGDNFFDAPTYRGENQQDLTEDERRAETTERSEIDNLNSQQNLSEAIATTGVAISLTVTINAAAGGAASSLGLGLGLVGCLTFGVEAASGKKSGLVRLGAMGLGTCYGVSQVWGTYRQKSGTTEVNRAVELAEIPPEPVANNSVPDWVVGGFAGFIFLLIVCKPFRDFVNRLVSGK